VDQVQWQTPATDSFRSRGGDRKDEMGLDQQARLMFPSPASLNYRSPNLKPYSERGGGAKGEQLANFICHSSLPAPPIESDGQKSSAIPPGSRQRLNPAFVAWLMGLPWWWTQPEPIVFGHSETPFAHNREQQHLSNSQGEQDSNG